MLKDLDLPTLQDRRTNAKLVFLYKVDEGLVPAIDPDTFIKLNRPKRRDRTSVELALLAVFAICFDHPKSSDNRIRRYGFSVTC
jgi:hypothetical protein